MLRYPRYSAGFTLVEVLIAVVIMAILAAVMIPNDSSDLNDVLLSTAQIIANDLAYGRSLAVVNNDRYCFTFNLKTNSYTLQHSGANTTLNILPVTAFTNPTDPPIQHIVNLSTFPCAQSGCGMPVSLAAVQTTSGTTVTSITQVEFNSYGQTTQAAATSIWLSIGTGSSLRYIPLFINAVTGLTTIGPFSGYGPPTPSNGN